MATYQEQQLVIQQQEQQVQQQRQEMARQQQLAEQQEQQAQQQLQRISQAKYRPTVQQQRAGLPQQITEQSRQATQAREQFQQARGQAETQLTQYEQELGTAKSQIKSAMDYEAAYQRVLKAQRKGMLWAIAAFGEGTEKSIAKDMIRHGVPASDTAMQRAYDARKELITDIKLGKVPDVAIKGNTIFDASGKPLAIDKAGDIYYKYQVSEFEKSLPPGVTAVYDTKGNLTGVQGDFYGTGQMQSASLSQYQKELTRLQNVQPVPVYKNVFTGEISQVPLPNYALAYTTPQGKFIEDINKYVKENRIPLGSPTAPKNIQEFKQALSKTYYEAKIPIEYTPNLREIISEKVRLTLQGVYQLPLGLYKAAEARIFTRQVNNNIKLYNRGKISKEEAIRRNDLALSKARKLMDTLETYKPGIEALGRSSAQGAALLSFWGTPVLGGYEAGIAAAKGKSGKEIALAGVGGAITGAALRGSTRFLLGKSFFQTGNLLQSGLYKTGIKGAVSVGFSKQITQGVDYLSSKIIPWQPKSQLGKFAKTSLLIKGLEYVNPYIGLSYGTELTKGLISNPVGTVKSAAEYAVKEPGELAGFLVGGLLIKSGFKLGKYAYRVAKGEVPKTYTIPSRLEALKGLRGRSSADLKDSRGNTILVVDKISGLQTTPGGGIRVGKGETAIEAFYKEMNQELGLKKSDFASVKLVDTVRFGRETNYVFDARLKQGVELKPKSDVKSVVKYTPEQRARLVQQSAAGFKYGEAAATSLLSKLTFARKGKAVRFEDVSLLQRGDLLASSSIFKKQRVKALETPFGVISQSPLVVEFISGKMKKINVSKAVKYLERRFGKNYTKGWTEAEIRQEYFLATRKGLPKPIGLGVRGVGTFLFQGASSYDVPKARQAKITSLTKKTKKYKALQYRKKIAVRPIDTIFGRMVNPEIRVSKYKQKKVLREFAGPISSASPAPLKKMGIFDSRVKILSGLTERGASKGLHVTPPKSPTKAKFSGRVRKLGAVATGYLGIGPGKAEYGWTAVKKTTPGIYVFREVIRGEVHTKKFNTAKEFNQYINSKVGTIQPSYKAYRGGEFEGIVTGDTILKVKKIKQIGYRGEVVNVYRASLVKLSKKQKSKLNKPSPLKGFFNSIRENLDNLNAPKSEVKRIEQSSSEGKRYKQIPTRWFYERPTSSEQRKRIEKEFPRFLSLPKKQLREKPKVVIRETPKTRFKELPKTIIREVPKTRFKELPKLIEKPRPTPRERPKPVFKEPQKTRASEMRFLPGLREERRVVRRPIRKQKYYLLTPTAYQQATGRKLKQRRRLSQIRGFEALRF